MEFKQPHSIIWQYVYIANNDEKEMRTNESATRCRLCAKQNETTNNTETECSRKMRLKKGKQRIAPLHGRGDLDKKRKDIGSFTGENEKVI